MLTCETDRPETPATALMLLRDTVRRSQQRKPRSGAHFHFRLASAYVSFASQSVRAISHVSGSFCRVGNRRGTPRTVTCNSFSVCCVLEDHATSFNRLKAFFRAQNGADIGDSNAQSDRNRSTLPCRARPVPVGFAHLARRQPRLPQRVLLLRCRPVAKNGDSPSIQPARAICRR